MSEPQAAGRARAEGAAHVAGKASVGNRTILLTPRQFQVARFVAAGFPTKLIAGCLGINCRTVETHVADVCLRAGFVHSSLSKRVLLGHAYADGEIALDRPVWLPSRRVRYR